MLNDFKLYFELGLKHIADITAYDHILFLVALCAVYSLQTWKKVLFLVTAFTIGHCITLIISGLKIVVFPSEVIEFLIPLTIFLTAMYNIFIPPNAKNIVLKYLIALCFGLVHGLGFSNFFKSLLGQDTSIALPLFSFNIGIEVGQMLIVICLLSISYIAVNVLRIPQRWYTIFVSVVAAVFAVQLMWDTKFW